MADWEATAAAHRQRQLKAIPPDWLLAEQQIQELSGSGTRDSGRLIQLQVARKAGILSERELDITENYTATQLRDKIALGQLKSVEVTIALAKRAALAQQFTCCLTEIFFGEGIERAKWLDRYYADTGTVVGPLHGLPISLKDTYSVKGHLSAVGFVESLKHPAQSSNAALVDLLLDAGAVLYCKTNVPQTMMTMDSENNIFGRTLNPHNTSLTAGGSTGGEGSLIAFRGSVLGAGTDLAGSIRMPALCNGIYGFKPTADRVPLKGQTISPFPALRLPGSLIPALGPLAPSVEDLSLFMEVVIGARPWKYDSRAYDLPWAATTSSDGMKRLRIGLLPEDPEYPLHPPVRRALNEIAAALERSGHTIVRLPHDPATAVSRGARISAHFLGLGQVDIKTIGEMAGEPLIKSVLRGAHPFGDGKFLVDRQLDVSRQQHELNIIRDAYIDSWQRVWLKHEIDVVIAAGAQSTAVPHDTFGDPIYARFLNVLDYPTGILPFGTASIDRDPDFVKSEADFQPDYIPDAVDGAPTAIQVIAPRFRDEECLGAMRIIDKDIRR